MPDDRPVESDTPPGHVVIALRIEAALLPRWFDEVRRVSAGHMRRMAVVEKPDEWIVRIELPEEAVAAWHAALAEAWQAFDGRG